jgi:hypothetical protein
MMARETDAMERERVRRQRQRNWAVAGALMAFVAIVYVVTMVKLQGG